MWNITYKIFLPLFIYIYYKSYIFHFDETFIILKKKIWPIEYIYFLKIQMRWLHMIGCVATNCAWLKLLRKSLDCSTASLFIIVLNKGNKNYFNK